MNPHSSGRLLISALVLLATLHGARAQTIYKCTAANGDVTYQDHPCPDAAKQTAETVVAPAPARAEPTPFEKLPTPASVPPSPQPPPAAAPPPEPVKPPVPSIWFCTRPDDGSRYVSRDGNPAPRWVPAGVLGIPQKSLAKTYGPGGGAGVSAPGEAKPKASHSPVDKRAGDYIEVDDDCVAASDQQACDYFQDELDQVDHKLLRAFKEEQVELEARRAQLQHDLEGC
jgi:hypothetical protein